MEAVDLRKITVAEFYGMEFPEDDRLLYEVINGQLVSRRAYSPRHQTVAGALLLAIHTFTTTKKLGEILPGPLDIVADECTVLQPDLVFIATANAHLITTDGVMGAPDLIVEVISPSSIYRDRVTKKALFEQFGVQEYWLVDPADNFIEIYALADGHYELLSAASVEEGQLSSGVLSGLVLDLNTLFA